MRRTLTPETRNSSRPPSEVRGIPFSAPDRRYPSGAEYLKLRNLLRRFRHERHFVTFAEMLQAHQNWWVVRRYLTLKVRLRLEQREEFHRLGKLFAHDDPEQVPSLLSSSQVSTLNVDPEAGSLKAISETLLPCDMRPIFDGLQSRVLALQDDLAKVKRQLEVVVQEKKSSQAELEKRFEQHHVVPSRKFELLEKRLEKNEERRKRTYVRFSQLASKMPALLDELKAHRGTLSQIKSEVKESVEETLKASSVVADLINNSLGARSTDFQGDDVSAIILWLRSLGIKEMQFPRYLKPIYHRYYIDIDPSQKAIIAEGLYGCKTSAEFVSFARSFKEQGNFTTVGVKKPKPQVKPGTKAQPKPQRRR